MNTRTFNYLLLSSFALILTACGGGTSSTQATDPVDTSTVALPRIVTTDNWSSARVIHQSQPMETSVEVVSNKLIIRAKSQDILEGAHLQIYLNTDNKAETGFQFDNEAWVDSGVDFLIEDGDLFQSTQNNTGWNWNVNVGAINYSINSDTVSASIDLSLLASICNNLKVGVMTRDEYWDIDTFYPASTHMQNIAVDYCNTSAADTVNPEITLLGANPVKLNTGDVFNDPGATAEDNIDGDITHKITLETSLNTSIVGSYTVTYLVSDAAGNSSSVSRTVIVTDAPINEGIMVDGNTSDWVNIPSFSSSSDAVMKVTDDEEKLYILVTSSNLGENIQVLMDTDNNIATGLDLSTQIETWAAGADYMIENNSFDKSKSNTLWSWDYGIAPIEYIETAGTLEIAIKKADFNFLGNTVPMGFVSRTVNWNVNYILPAQSLPAYTLKFPTAVNPVQANDDSTTTNNNQTLTIDVLNNDISTTNSALSVDRIISQPNSGSATVSANKVVYTPVTGFTGAVSFNYEVSDANGNKDSANIRVIVTEQVVINTAPIATNDSIVTAQDQAVNIDVLANDTDAEGNSLTITSNTNPSNGTTKIVNGKIVYSPSTGFFGTDSFNYTIDDGNGATASASVSITVEQLIVPAPNAVNDAANTQRNLAITIDALANDSDANGLALTISSVSNPANGTALIVANKIKYTPSNLFVGADNFSYTINNSQGGTDTAAVTITVAAPSANNAPDAVEDIASVDFDKTVTVDVLANDTDPDNDTLTVQSIVQPPVGSATLNANGSIFFNPQNNVGSISIGYTVSDGRGGTDFAVLTIASTNPNDGNDSYPDITNEFVTTSANTAIFVDVLANDTDADGDVLVLDQVDQGENGTTVKINGGVRYTPNPGFTGTDTFYYGVHDGHGHNGSGFVKVTVIPNT